MTALPPRWDGDSGAPTVQFPAPVPRTVARHRDPSYLNDLRAFREAILILVLLAIFVNVVVADVLLWSSIHTIGK